MIILPPPTRMATCFARQGLACGNGSPPGTGPPADAPFSRCLTKPNPSAASALVRRKSRGAPGKRMSLRDSPRTFCAAMRRAIGSDRGQRKITNRLQLRAKCTELPAYAHGLLMSLLGILEFYPGFSQIRDFTRQPRLFRHAQIAAHIASRPSTNLQQTRHIMSDPEQLTDQQISARNFLFVTDQAVEMLKEALAQIEIDATKYAYSKQDISTAQSRLEAARSLAHIVMQTSSSHDGQSQSEEYTPSSVAETFAHFRKAEKKVQSSLKKLPLLEGSQY